MNCIAAYSIARGLSLPRANAASGGIEALAEALVAFSDPGRRLKAGRESRAIAEVMFDSRKQGETLHRLLRSISTPVD